MTYAFRRHAGPGLSNGAQFTRLPDRRVDRGRARRRGCYHDAHRFEVNDSRERSRTSRLDRRRARVPARLAGSHLERARSRGRSWPVRRGRMAARRGRRRALARDERGRGVRAGRRRILRSVRRGAAAVGERAASRDRRSRVDCARRLAGAASAQSLPADDAHERALFRGARRRTQRRSGGSAAASI